MCNGVGRKNRPRCSELGGDERETFFWQPADVIIPNYGVELYIVTHNQGLRVKTVWANGPSYGGTSSVSKPVRSRAYTLTHTLVYTVHWEALQNVKLIILKNLKCIKNNK